MPKPSPPLTDTLLRRLPVGEPDACWLWPGNRQMPAGYGLISKRGARHRAHRIAYEAFVGPIPDGMKVCHRCDNPPCCNPAHLFLGSHTDNMRDMWTKGRGRSGLGVGEGNVNAKLTEEQVRHIRTVYHPYRVTAPQLAAQYGVSVGTIKTLLQGGSWRGVA